jgi:hypothetical protein
VSELGCILDELKKLVSIAQVKEKQDTEVRFLTVPEAGGTRSFAIGTTKINFRTGVITNPDMTPETLTITSAMLGRDFIRSLPAGVEAFTTSIQGRVDKEFLRSLSLHTDQQITLKILPNNQFTVDADYDMYLTYLSFTEIEIVTTMITNIKIFVSTNPEAAVRTFTKAADITTLTIKDANFTIVDDADTTKGVKFSTGLITTGNTKTITVPNANITLSTCLNRYTRTARITNAGVLKPIRDRLAGRGAVTSAVNDIHYFWFNCDGTETLLELNTYSTTTSGKLSVFINGVNNGGLYDDYVASNTATDREITLIEPVVPGLNEITIQVNSKNAASTGYACYIIGMSLQ